LWWAAATKAAHTSRHVMHLFFSDDIITSFSLISHGWKKVKFGISNKTISATLMKDKAPSETFGEHK